MNEDKSYHTPYLPYAGSSPFDSHSIDANNQTLLRQAPMTADEYLHSAIDHIDDRLGKGYAKQHPELVAAFMQTSAIDLGTAVIARAIESITSAINANFDGIVEASRSDHPLQEETLSDIENALNHIAEAIRGDKEK